MKKLNLFLVVIIIAGLWVACTCDCSKHYMKKIDPKLTEAFEHSKSTEVNPYFAVEIKLNKTFNDVIKNNIIDTGVKIESNTDSTLIAKAQTRAIEKTAKFEFVEYIKLLTENYYPNK